MRTVVTMSASAVFSLHNGESLLGCIFPVSELILGVFYLILYLVLWVFRLCLNHVGWPLVADRIDLLYLAVSSRISSTVSLMPLSILRHLASSTRVLWKRSTCPFETLWRGGAYAKPTLKQTKKNACAAVSGSQKWSGETIRQLRLRS